MSTTPQMFLDGNEHYHPRMFTTLQNHNKSVKQYVLLPSFFISKILYFQQEWILTKNEPIQSKLHALNVVVWIGKFLRERYKIKYTFRLAHSKEIWMFLVMEM